MSDLPSFIDPDVFEKVRECFCEALELDIDEVSWDSRLLDDLGAESLDLLDVVFRLERAFDIQIPRGGLEAQAREYEKDGLPGEVDGRLTEAGRERLLLIMPEVPPEELVVGMKTAELGRVFRVGTFCNIVLALLKQKEMAAASEA